MLFAIFSILDSYSQTQSNPDTIGSGSETLRIYRILVDE
jgi:hypothetical protein